MYFNNLADAQTRHESSGGYLLDYGNGGYFVTDDNPAEHRSFDGATELERTRNAIDYAFRLADADFDETKMVDAEVVTLLKHLRKLRTTNHAIT
jgi:hypothetical protein